MCTIKELHNRMTDIVAVKANECGGRINLARKIGCSDRLVHGILDKVEYPSKKSFELWFGPMTDFDEIDEDDKPMAGLRVNDSYVEPSVEMIFAGSLLFSQYLRSLLWNY